DLEPYRRVRCYMEAQYLAGENAGAVGIAADYVIHRRPARQCALAPAAIKPDAGNPAAAAAPMPTRRPPSIWMIRSQWRIVLGRCAMMKLVRPPISRSTDSMIAASVRASTALVGSSRIRIGASLRNARASAMRWR